MNGTIRLARAELRKLVTTRALPVSVAIAIVLAIGSVIIDAMVAARTEHRAWAPTPADVLPGRWQRRPSPVIPGPLWPGSAGPRRTTRFQPAVWHRRTRQHRLSV